MGGGERVGGLKPVLLAPNLTQNFDAAPVKDIHTVRTGVLLPQF